jgi:hypothetical protein
MANQPGAQQQESSVSPDPHQSYSEHHQPQQLNLPHHDRPLNGREPEHLLEPPTSSYGPPPVDFTSYSSSSHNTHRDPPTTTYPLVSTAGEVRTNRKRTLSAADRNLPQQALTIEERPNGNAQSNAVRNRSPGEAAIDPSLSAYARGANAVQEQAVSGETREERMLRIRREREEMQARLRQMDQELQAMEEEEG